MIKLANAYACFEFCEFSRELIIPEGVTSIDDYCFSSASYGSGGFSSVKFSSTLKEIGASAFNAQTRMCCDITFPEGFLVIKEGAFKDCPSITGIKLPSTTQTIQKGAFRNCFNVSRIVCNAIEPPTVLDYAFDFNLHFLPGSILPDLATDIRKFKTAHTVLDHLGRATNACHIEHPLGQAIDYYIHYE